MIERQVKGTDPHPHMESLARLHGLNQDKLEITEVSVADRLRRGRERVAKPAPAE